MIHFHRRLAARTAATTCRRVRACSFRDGVDDHKSQKALDLQSSWQQPFAPLLLQFSSSSSCILFFSSTPYIRSLSLSGYSNSAEQHGTYIFITRTPSAILISISISETCACCLGREESSAMIRYCVFVSFFSFVECPHVQPAGRVDPRARRRRRLLVSIQIQRQKYGLKQTLSFSS